MISKYAFLKLTVFAMSMSAVWGVNSKAAGDKKEPVTKATLKPKVAPASKKGLSVTKTVAPTAPTKIVTMRDFLQDAYDISPNLMAARYSRNEKESELMNAMGRLAPDVTVSVYSGKNINKNSFGAINPDRGVQDFMHDSWNKDNPSTLGSAELSLNLYRGGSDVAAITAANAKQVAYDCRFTQELVKFLIESVEIYIGVLNSRDALDIYDKLARQAAHNVERVNTEYIVGNSTKTLVLSAKAELATATSALMKAQTDLTNAEQAYLQLTGKLPGKLQLPTNTLKLPSSLEQALTIAESKSTSLLLATAEKRAAQGGLSSSIGEMLPSIDLTAKYQEDLGSNNKIRDSGYGSIGIQMSYKLLSNSYSGGGTHISKLNASVNHNTAAGYNLDAARKQMKQAVTAAWYNWETAKSQMKQVVLSVEAGRSAYEGALAEFKLGQRSYYDLLKVQEQFLKAELQHLNTLKEEIVGRYKLLAEIGMLTPTSIGLTLNASDDNRGVSYD
jgi:outer membrane protein